MEDHNLTKNWVLIRGLIRSRFHWGHFPQSFKQHLKAEQVIEVELPGNGYLYKENTPTQINEAVNALKTQLPQQLTSYGLVGISLGGMLATHWAQAYPTEVERLVLINSSSSLNWFYQRLQPQNYLAILKNLLLLNPDNFEKFILKTTSNNKESIRHLKDYIEFQKTHPLTKINFINQLRLASQVDFTKTPVMPKLILASKADRLVNSVCSEKIAAYWNCPIHYHPTAGHDLPLDDAAWIISKINSSY